MDVPVAMRVAAALDATLGGCTLTRIDPAGSSAYRLVFEREQRRTPVTVSLAPQGPWCGITPRWSRFESKPPDAFAATVLKLLRGSRLEAIRHPHFDRVIEMVFAGGSRLAAELGGAGANLVAIDPNGRVMTMARRTKAARKRLREGEPYRPRPLPSGRVVPLGLTAEQIDGALQRGRRPGRELRELLLSAFLGLGAEAARLVVEECAREGRSAGEVLSARLRDLQQGRLEPAIVADEDPRVAAEAGRWDPARFRLLPWVPAGSLAEIHAQGQNAAETVGLYCAAADAAALLERRTRALGSILDRERRRTAQAALKARRDLEGFEDPERFRVWGEALLAGMHAARRAGDHALVPDPYDAEGPPLSVPAPARLTLPAAAAAHFQSHRRARRGRVAARRRLEQLAEWERGLARLTVRAEGVRGLAAIRELESEMRAAGLPIGVGRRSRSPREALPDDRPRLEGVRMFTSSDGWTILVGRGGRDNQRLTFKLAAPEDFWLHVLGRPGAHVVLRNPQRRAEPPERSLREAAALAAHFSDARDERLAEVQWTRRKLVRKARNASPGTVLVKRFKTLAVRPGLPLTSRFD